MDTAPSFLRTATQRSFHLLFAALLALSLVLQVAPAQVALAAGHDDLANATEIIPPLLNDSTNTTGASRDTGEIGGNNGTCNFPAIGNTRSVWYRYSPTSDGFLYLDTFGSNYDTVLEVFSGPATPTFAQLTSLLCNDDAGTTSQSALVVPVTSGTHYYIVVRRFGGGLGGDLVFSATFDTTLHIYVDQVNGLATNPGTQERPLKTIQQGINAAQPNSSVVHIVSTGEHGEAVVINKSLTLDAPTDAVSVNSFTLNAGADVTLTGSAITAPVVNVNSGASIQQGISLVGLNGSVNVGNGTFAENVTIAKPLTLIAVNEGSATIEPASGNAVTISVANVIVRGLNLKASAGTAVNITGGSNITVQRNNITDSTNGVANSTATIVNAQSNYWGDASGPTHASNPGGSGTNVSNNVSYRPWCSAPIPTCGALSGEATKLVFSTSPGNSTAAQPLSPQPVVQVQDNANNIDTSYIGSVTIAIDTNPGGGTLAGTLTVPVVNGEAVFTDLSIDKVGTGYTLIATSGSLTSATSTAFDITAGPVTQLVFTQQPTDTEAGATIAPPIVVEARDAGGNVVTNFTGSVMIAFGTNPVTPGGATLSGTTAANAVAGVATFSNLSINKPGTYTFVASILSPSVSQTSDQFVISAGPPTKLVFATNPGDTPATSPLSPTPQVEVRDAADNVVTNYNGTVTIQIGNNPSSGTLSGATTVPVVNGVASFSNLSIDKAGTGYTLVATGGSLTQATSTAFDITVGAPATLEFSVQPSNAIAGDAISPAIVVRVLDAGGNLVTSYNSDVSLGIQTNPGGGTFITPAAATVAASGGIATFNNIAIDKSGVGYALQATSENLTPVTSAPFNITHAAAAALVFQTSPGNTEVNANLTPAPVVRVVDIYGNTVTSANNAITLGFDNNPTGAAFGGVGSLTLNATAGEATFNDISINQIGTGYTLKATAAALTPAISNPFNITKLGAAVIISDLLHTYDGTPKAVSVTTNPSGLTTVITYSSTLNGYGPSQTAPTDAGTYDVFAQVDDPNYGGSATATLTINKATATVTLTDLNQTYDGTPRPASATTMPPALPVVFTYSGGGYGPSATPPTNAGSYTVQATIDHQNYQGSTTDTLVIAKANATITVTNLNQNYDGSEHPVTVTTTPAGLPYTVTYNGSSRPPTSAGSYTVVVTINHQNYQGATTVTLVINKASQTITFGTLPNKVYGDPPFTVSATASSGLPVTFVASGQCTVSGNTVTITGAGSCTITATQAGNENYSAATPVARVFTISKADQVISFGVLVDRVLANSPFTVSATASSGLAVTFTATGQCTVSGTTVTLTGLGVCNITANQAGNANYNAAAPVSRSFRIVEAFLAMMPMVMDHPKPDLVGSFTLSTGTIVPDTPVVVTVTVTNTGTASAEGFWVDFYIEPSSPPTDTNQPWNRRCKLVPCYGIAWYVDQVILPGESITLTSTPDSYYAPNTRWQRIFLKDTKSLYLYVDSWNPGMATGAVEELDETNNVASFTITTRRTNTDASVQPLPDTLPPRPVRP